jgi:uncharacterized membrane-anchored protein YjiN (DUF445 family)
VLWSNRDFIERKISEQLLNIPFISDLLAGVIAGEVIGKVSDLMQDVINNPDHELRGRFDDYLNKLVEDLETAGPLRDRLHAFRLNAMRNPALQKALPPLWGGIRESLRNDLSSEHSQIESALESILIQMGTHLESDEKLRQKVNNGIERVVLEELVPRRGLIGDFIEETARRWPASEISDRLEQQVGRDLQFIRINGTIVGGLVGLLIFLVSSHS